MVRDLRLWLLEEPVAPPMPSRPVRPPSKITTSPGAGRSRTHVLRRGSAYHGAHFQALGNIAGVVDLADMARGQADLVAVAGVAGSGSLGQLALGELAGQGLGHRACGDRRSR